MGIPIGEITLPKMEDIEVSPGVYLIGEPSPVEGTSMLRCLANYHGTLAIVELSVKFTPSVKG